MPSYQPPLKGTAYVCYVSLVAQADTKLYVAAPTLEAGDVQVAIDDGPPANLTTLPVVDADFPKRVRVALSAAEMNGDRVTIIFSDVAGAEWCDLTLDLATVANQFDTLATAVAAVPTAAEIWAATTRTLTQTAAAVTATVAGSALTVVRGVTFEATLTGLSIPAAWTKLYFTVKAAAGALDTASVVQIVVSNPGAGTDGLLYLDGAAGTLAQGSLTVDQGAGTLAIVLADDTTTFLEPGTYAYDVKAIVTDTSELLTAAGLTVTQTVTEAIT